MSHSSMFNQWDSHPTGVFQEIGLVWRTGGFFVSFGNPNQLKISIRWSWIGWFHNGVYFCPQALQTGIADT